MSEIIVLGLCAFIASLIHTFTKIAKMQKMGDVSFRQFIKKEWVYMVISALTIVLALIAHEMIAKIQAVHNYIGDWMVVVYMGLGWASDSIFYNIFGRLEKKFINEIKDKTK